ncbi:MAG: YfaZ family protein [Gammaproteobacteria bacterium]|nr:YfaZ family protein [Gammaproteobacteria bacterium]MCW8910904.1 YfaZ family protein [Gammaproteobacteria bacterium]MCW9004594.1 YfaZ family protein [Gammaproteobacteria bacterium]MCW9056718.1 YfaZ family protein [Gammaproteobacteria bacterium]
MLRKFTTIFGFMILSATVQAEGFDLRLANETAEVIYLTESSTFGYGGADIGLGLLFNEADDFMISGSAMVTGHSAGNNRPLQFGIGVKLAMVSIDQATVNEEVGALAIGAQVRYLFPSSTPVALLAEGFIAPEVVSFSGAEQYREYRFALELEVTPSARAYLGYRKIEVDVENINQDIEIDDHAHLGIKIEF